MPFFASLVIVLLIFPRLRARILAISPGSVISWSYSDATSLLNDLAWTIIITTTPNNTPIPPPVIGMPLGSLLNSPDTKLEHLSAMKEYAKEMVSAAETEAKYETRIVIYYAAIAAALVFRSQKDNKVLF